MARPPMPTAGVCYASLDLANQVDSLNSLAEGNGYNFSVLNLISVIESLFTDMEKMDSELMNCNTRARYIANAVSSTDSNLGSAWNNVGASMSKFSEKFGTMASQIKTLADNYIQSTIDNEIAAATNTDGIATSIDGINNRLDALFTE